MDLTPEADMGFSYFNNMIELTSSNKMSSLNLLKMINKFRAEEGQKPIRNNQFIARVEDELDDLNAYKTFVTNKSGRGGARTPQKYYNLNIDQDK